MSEENGFMNGFYAGKNADNGSFGGSMGGWGWIWIILIFAVFAGGWGNGFGGFGGAGNQGAAANYVLTSDFSQLSRQLSDATAMTERKLDSVTNGICSLGYDQLAQMNGINTNILTQGNAIQTSIAQGNNALASQLAQCCCDNREAIAGVNYNMVNQANATQRLIENGFCTSGYNLADQSCQTRTLMQTNTRDVIDNNNANTRAILDALNRQAIEAKDAKIAEQNQMIFNLQLAASQERQNNILIDKLGYHCPQPAYVVQPPQQVTFPTNCCGGVNYASAGGCGCMG